MTTVTATNITTTTATIRSPAVTMAHMWITTTTRGANRMLVTSGTAGMTTETAMTTVTATNLTTITATIRSPAVTLAHMWITTTTRGANRMLVKTGTNSIFGLLSMDKATDVDL